MHESIKPEQFKELMETYKAQSFGDAEAAHGRADDLMCRVLTDLGYGDGVKVFEEMEKWYA